jgi:hypothetical protein
MAILEKSSEEASVLDKIKKTIPAATYKENLIRIHGLYVTLYGKTYVNEAFGWYKKPFESTKDTRFFECLIELGFSLYLLARMVIESVKPDEESRFANLVSLKTEFATCDSLPADPKKSLFSGKEKEGPARAREAFKFFKEKVVSIDIVREDTLERVFFPKLPICFHLKKSVHPSNDEDQGGVHQHGGQALVEDEAAQAGGGL